MNRFEIQQGKPCPQGRLCLLETKPISSHILQATILVSAQIIKMVYKRALSLYAKYAQPEGLKNMTLPSEFVEEEHMEEIKNNVKRFVLKHIVIDYLLQEVSNKKISVANYPRLKGMILCENGDAKYLFDLSVAKLLPLKDWKLFAFKSPKRKRYKDLDKQVDLFIKREIEKHKKQDSEIVENKDWVNFESIIVDNNEKAIVPIHKSNFWMRINTAHVEKPFQTDFIDKKINSSFIADRIPVNEEFQDTLTENSKFLITIKSIAKGSHLCVEALKTIFKLKNKMDIHNKLIEVFSYRNDISQRRSIIEEVFHLFFSKHRFEIPKHLTIRKQESLLEMLKKQPDYQVYKSQKDFYNKVATLAEKLLKEEILIDQIAYKENLKTSGKDIKHYLTMFNNSRLREFVYFKPAFEPLEETDLPLSEGYLRQSVLREKTLNHIIFTLTK
jgi:FKBP-type peptidyl-prolyl cis-trans isomerase (trigger factor)